MSGTRQRTLGTGGQHVLDYLKRMQAENPNFYYAVQTDSEVNGGTVFWADATARMNYNYFGDTVIFDTTYRTSRFRVPLAALTGLNHHGQPVLFGCALILNESESSFAWLFQRWIHAMSGRRPASITTEPERLIQVAVSQVLPETRHRFSKWAVFREAQEKLSQAYISHPNFDEEFRKCVDESETVDEFESSWESLVQRHYLVDNEWVRSMYGSRQQWVPVYMRDAFFGEFSGSGVLNEYFNGFVSASTTIQMLIRSYERAVVSWQEEELKADYETTHTTPVLKTPSPMEKQAAGLYTRRIFKKFQDELVETLANPATKIDETGTVTTYKVAKFGEDHKANAVSFDSSETKAGCSCHMFESSGIVCRHVLSVFRAKNVLKLPSRYVLKRWTRDAKTGFVIEEHRSELPDNSQELVTARYNSLRQEAIKYVEEGAKSIHIYNIAMDALKDAAKKVSAVKNPSSVAVQVGVLANGGGTQESHSNEENTMESFPSVDEKEKKIQELSAELETIQQRCEVYRGNLLAVLRDMEEQKLKLAVKVQNAKLSLKE